MRMTRQGFSIILVALAQLQICFGQDYSSGTNIGAGETTGQQLQQPQLSGSQTAAQTQTQEQQVFIPYYLQDNAATSSQGQKAAAQEIPVEYAFGKGAANQGGQPQAKPAPQQQMKQGQQQSTQQVGSGQSAGQQNAGGLQQAASEQQKLNQQTQQSQQTAQKVQNQQQQQQPLFQQQQQEVASALSLPSQNNPVCSAAVDKFIKESPIVDTKKNDKFLYLFHVPKTAGRALYNCLWKGAVPPAQVCAQGYNWLHIDENPSDCMISATHEDYTVTKYLPPNSGFATVLRDPVTRFVSAYEFMVESTVRALRRVGEPSEFSHKTHVPFQVTNKKIGPQTKSVWPWMYLSPSVESDARTRMRTLIDNGRYIPGKVFNFDNSNITEKQKNTLSYYDNPFYVPLQEFITSPLAYKLLHNGATFQILGISNNTHMDPDVAMQLRRCAFTDQQSAKKLVDFAKKRLDGFLHVGTTERLQESMNIFMTWVGWRWDTEAFKPSRSDFNINFDTDDVINSKDYHESSQYREEIRLRKELNHIHNELSRREFELNNLPVVHSNFERIQELQQRRSDLRSQVYQLSEGLADIMYRKTGIKAHIHVVQNGTFTKAGSLSNYYHTCHLQTQLKSFRQREQSFKQLRLSDGSGVNIQKTIRSDLPRDLLTKIYQLNAMDVALYQYADQKVQKEVEQQQKMGIYQELPPEPQGMRQQLLRMEAEKAARMKGNMENRQTKVQTEYAEDATSDEFLGAVNSQTYQDDTSKTKAFSQQQLTQNY